MRRLLFVLVIRPTHAVLSLHVRVARFHERTRDPLSFLLWATLRGIGSVGIKIAEALA